VIAVGDTLPFMAYNFVRFSTYRIRAVCQSIGAHSYLFVEDAHPAKFLPEEFLLNLQQTFDEMTITDLDHGIFDLGTETFGDPPDVDRDRRIFIVVLDIRDGSEMTGGPIVGYFDPSNENFPDRTNHEIIYIDASPLDVTSHLARATLAHEFQHLIHWGHDPDEEDWIDEGCSGYAELITGYAAEYGPRFLSNPNNDLTYFLLATSTDADYDKTFLFITYLAERYGGALTIRQLVDEPAHGIDGINDTFIHRKMSVRFRDVFLAWTVANYLGKNAIYGYTSLSLHPLATKRIDHLPSTQQGGSVERWAAEYIEFALPVNGLDLIFRTTRSDLFAPRVVVWQDGSPAVLDISLDKEGTGQLKIEHVEKTVLVVSNISGSRQTYSYEAQAFEPTSIIEEIVASVPSTYALLSPFPNPANPATTIVYHIPTPPLPRQGDKGTRGQGEVWLEVWDVRGRRVRWLVAGEVQEPGVYCVVWDGRDEGEREVSSGVYFIHMRIQEVMLTQKITLLR
jgi:hypothetical protein